MSTAKDVTAAQRKGEEILRRYPFSARYPAGWVGPDHDPRRGASSVAAELQKDLDLAARSNGPLRGVTCKVRARDRRTVEVSVMDTGNVMVINREWVKDQLDPARKDLPPDLQAPPYTLRGGKMLAMIFAQARLYGADGADPQFVIDFERNLRQGQVNSLIRTIAKTGPFR